LKLITWNVNGLRACLTKGLADYIASSKADYIAFQETKTNEPQPEIELPGYAVAWNNSERPGYSGTMCLYKNDTFSKGSTGVKILRGLGLDRLDGEGRLITLECPKYFLVNAYVPNSQGDRSRWYYRLEWDEAFCDFLTVLQERKPVIVCGDFNVARDYIDIYPENHSNPEQQHGFLSEERDGLNALLDLGLCDAFRELHPDESGAYSWWSGKTDNRKFNRGRRIDYFLVSEQLMPRVKSCVIRSDITGSDHAPIEMVIDL
jgi:exodeoxyribonuclease-3